jgi:tetraacyldisaccharide 4'-kinase
MLAPRFWRHGGGALWPWMLAPASYLWRLGAWTQQRMATPLRAGVPVISVGNLVVGGAGKTPTAIALVHRLAAGGIRAHIISRGYGGSAAGPLRVDPSQHTAAEVGDEALLLARAAPTWVARDRAAAARAATAAGAQALVLDDAHQNFSLVKDLSLIVNSGQHGVGNGRVMPAGPLREPVASGMRRADAVIAIGEAGAIGGDLPAAIAAAGKPVFAATLAPTPEAKRLSGRRVVGFAGIARPDKFFATLRQLDCIVVGEYSFPDHYRYRPDEIMRLVDIATQADALPVTTAKDAVRLPAEARSMVEVVDVRLAFADPDALDHWLAQRLRR